MALLIPGSMLKTVTLCLYRMSVKHLNVVLFVSNDYQPGKSLYTTVRELVENALDSAESIAELPFVEVTM